VFDYRGRFVLDICRLNKFLSSTLFFFQYPSLHICTDSMLRFIIEYNETQIETSSKEITIDRLRSFTFYSFTIYAINELGSSPKSKSLQIQTSESGRILSIDLKENSFCFVLSSIWNDHGFVWLFTKQFNSIYYLVKYDIFSQRNLPSLCCIYL